ncbi:tetratricopeptide repeat protein [bacterium]|nr:tetratricopeptide repeat protein [bacterium]
MAKKRYSHKQIRKSLKQDELRNFLNRTIRFFRINTENLLILAIIIGVIAVLVPLYFRHQAANEKRAQNLLSRAISYYNYPLAGGDKAAGDFRSMEDKYKKCQQAFAEVATVYRKTQAAGMASLGEANSWFFLKEYEKAILIYQEQLQKMEKKLLRSTIQERLAACQENLGQWSEALATYQAILTEQPEYFNRRAVNISIAGCYWNLDRKAEARELLAKEQSEEPGSYWSEIARRQMVVYK